MILQTRIHLDNKNGLNKAYLI